MGIIKHKMQYVHSYGPNDALERCDGAGWIGGIIGVIFTCASGSNRGWQLGLMRVATLDFFFGFSFSFRVFFLSFFFWPSER